MKIYRARFLNTFLKQEKKLDADIKERVVEAVEEILSGPYSGVNLKGNLRGYWNKKKVKYLISEIPFLSQTPYLLF